MKCFLFIVVLISVGSSVSAQDLAMKPTVELMVLKSSWGRAIDMHPHDKLRHGALQDDIQARQGARGFERDGLGTDPNQSEGYQYSVKVRATGTRTLTEVDWTIIFYNPKTHTELGRHLFSTKRKIKPGEEVDLRQFSTMPPATVLDARSGEQPQEKDLVNEVIIRKVVHEDDPAPSN